MNFPSDLKYTRDYAWVHRGDNIATIGITDFAQRELSDIAYIKVKTIGDTLPQDTVFGTAEAIKAVLDLFISVNGEVIAFSEPLVRKSEVVNTDPYSEGWMMQIAMSIPEERDTLLTAEEYRQLIGA